MAYRELFRDDFASFHEIQVLSVAGELEQHPAKLAEMWVYDDGIVKGVLSCTREGELADFYVEPLMLNRGIGSRMLEAILRTRDDLHLWVLEANPGARHFYEKFGFVPTGRSQWVEGTRQREIEYRLARGKTDTGL